MINSRQETARLLQENDLMDFVKSMGSVFGNNGKLPSVTVKTKTEGAFYISDMSQRKRK